MVPSSLDYKHCTLSRDALMKALDTDMPVAERMLEEARADASLRDKIRDLTIALCYDRVACNELGADYVNLGEEDILKLGMYALCLLKPDYMQ